MAVHPPEQLTHDRINLGRLVRRLEKAISDDSWDDVGQQDVWTKAQDTLQKVKYAKKLLKNVEMYDTNPTSKTSQRYRNFDLTLGRIESFVLDIDKRLAPQASRPSPLLPHIPIPIVMTTSTEAHSVIPLDDTLSSQIGQPSSDGHALSPTEDELLLPADLPTSPVSSTSFSFPSATLESARSPDFPPRSARGVVPTPAFLQNSGVIQQELSEQLAQMAAQLKRNATHFSETLASDQAVVEDAKAKIEGNFETMQTQRVRLRDHRGRSSSTTCLVLMSILVVVISFVLMFFVIRLT